MTLLAALLPCVMLASDLLRGVWCTLALFNLETLLGTACVCVSDACNLTIG